MGFFKKVMGKHPAVYSFVRYLYSQPAIMNHKMVQKLIISRYIYYVKKHPHGKRGVMIETTLNCNAKCLPCYHSQATLNGIMTMKLFRKIINDCVASNINFVWMSVYGEPLMDPYFVKRVKFLKENGISYGIYTNASMLTQKLSKELISLGNLHRINFSVLGFDKKVYETMMPNLKRDIAYKNILHFLKLKNNAGQNIHTTVSNIKCNINNKDIKDYISYWKKKRVDSIRIKELWRRTGGQEIQQLGSYGRLHNKELWQAPCIELYGNLNIYYNGKVSPCCDDNDLRRLIVGDMNVQNLSDIYNGRTLKELRQTHIGNKRSKHELCGKCNHNRIW